MVFLLLYFLKPFLLACKLMKICFRVEMNINILEYSLVKAVYGNVNFVTNICYVIPWT